MDSVKSKDKVVAYVMTLNEEEVIGPCLDSLTWCDEIIVADTGSTDSTLEIAKSKGAKILQLSFEGFGPTRNKIINSIDAEWIVCFDADEVCTKQLADEIQKELQAPKFNIYQANRLSFIMGKPIRHSGWFPDFRHAILFRKGFYSYTNDKVHETFKAEGPVGRLKSVFNHYSVRHLEQMMKKERDYALLGAERAKKKNPTAAKAFWHSFWTFNRIFFIRKGFLDGWRGFLIAASAAHSTLFRYCIAMEKIKEKETNSL